MGKMAEVEVNDGHGIDRDACLGTGAHIHYNFYYLQETRNTSGFELKFSMSQLRCFWT